MTTAKQNIVAIIRDKRGIILSIGRNNYQKTHPFQAALAKRHNREKAIYLHAEIAAIVGCKDITKAHSIEIVRYMKDGTLGLAKPCAICLDAIRNHTPIKNIVHS